MHFDWSTLALQTVNVLVLLWLLRRFLFRPVAAIIAARKKAAEDMLAEAASARQQAQAAVEQLALREKSAAASSARILDDARSAAAKERLELLDQAKAEAAGIRDAARAKLEQERRQVRSELEVQALQLAVSIASKLLGRIPVQVTTKALLEALGTIPENEWRPLAEPDATIEVVTAAPLDGSAQASFAALVHERLGCPVRFGVDPSLIAGAELRGPHATLHNNWRADLDHIAEELRSDDKQLVVA